MLWYHCNWLYESDRNVVYLYQKNNIQFITILLIRMVYLIVVGSLLNIWVHIVTVPACGSGTLTNYYAATQEYHATNTGHDTPPGHSTQDSRPICGCAIHWWGMSHWNTYLPILMSWVRPNREILPKPSTHTSECWNLWCWYGDSQSEAR